ncbi:uncharacterized protein [Pyrus communis]|uniref:uncharacterized protein n=1 Tax=Pyrus communis TaxID=23211 RepID=UPI0035C01523
MLEASSISLFPLLFFSLLFRLSLCLSVFLCVSLFSSGSDRLEGWLDCFFPANFGGGIATVWLLWLVVFWFFIPSHHFYKRLGSRGWRVFGIEKLGEATDGFRESSLIKGSVYKGFINGDFYAIKKMKWNACEELKIL